MKSSSKHSSRLAEFGMLLHASSSAVGSATASELDNRAKIKNAFRMFFILGFVLSFKLDSLAVLNSVDVVIVSAKRIMLDVLQQV